MLPLFWLAFFLRSGKKTASASDQDLLRTYRETGDLQPVGELFERYSVQIYGICRKYLQDEEERRDAAMEVFEYLIKELRKYEIEKFPQWLGRATRSFCLMRIRKNSTEAEKANAYKKNEAGVVEFVPEPHHSHDDEKEMSLRELETALAALNLEQKRCIELFFLQHKSYQEVSELTGYSLMQVKSYIQNGKRNLRISLEGRI